MFEEKIILIVFTSEWRMHNSDKCSLIKGTELLASWRWRKKKHFNVIGLLPFLRAPFTVSYVEKTILQEIMLYFTILGGDKFHITLLIPAVLPYLKKITKTLCFCLTQQTRSHYMFPLTSISSNILEWQNFLQPICWQQTVVLCF